MVTTSDGAAAVVGAGTLVLDTFGAGAFVTGGGVTGTGDGVGAAGAAGFVTDGGRTLGATVPAELTGALRWSNASTPRTPIVRFSGSLDLQVGDELRAGGAAWDLSGAEAKAAV